MQPQSVDGQIRNSSLQSRSLRSILLWTGEVPQSIRSDLPELALYLNRHPHFQHYNSLRDHFEARIGHLESLLNVQAAESSDHVVKRALADAYAAGAIGSSLNGQGATTSSSHPFDTSSSYYYKESESPEASQSGDEAAGAAFALEVLAGGDQPVPNDEKSKAAILPLLSLEEFARTSVLAQDSNSRLEGNSRIPLLGFLNRRNITDSILACLQTK